MKNLAVSLDSAEKVVVHWKIITSIFDIFEFEFGLPLVHLRLRTLWRLTMLFWAKFQRAVVGAEKKIVSITNIYEISSRTVWLFRTNTLNMPKKNWNLSLNLGLIHPFFQIENLCSFLYFVTKWNKTSPYFYYLIHASRYKLNKWFDVILNNMKEKKGEK